MENNIIINPYLFYGLIGAIAYLLWLTKWLNKMVKVSIGTHDINAKLVTESFEYISEDIIKLSEGLDKLEDKIQYVSNKQTGTTS